MSRLTRTIRPANATIPIETHQLPNPAMIQRTQIASTNTMDQPMYARYLEEFALLATVRNKAIAPVSSVLEVWGE